VCYNGGELDNKNRNLTNNNKNFRRVYGKERKTKMAKKEAYVLHPEDGVVEERSDVVLGDGGVRDFGSGVFEAATKVEDPDKNEEKLNADLYKEQAKKLGRGVMRWAKEFTKEQKETEQKLDLQRKMGRFAVFANRRRAELGMEEAA